MSANPTRGRFPAAIIPMFLVLGCVLSLNFVIKFSIFLGSRSWVWIACEA